MKFKIMVYIITAILLSGCFQKKPEIPVDKPQETILDLSIIATGTQKPLAVYFLSLKKVDRFKKLDYYEIAKKYLQKSKNGIIKRTKITLSPQKMFKKRLKLGKDVQYYAVAVGFSNVDINDNWRYIQEIIPESVNDITLLINENNITKIEKEKE